jgi:hypothetical protein
MLLSPPMAPRSLEGFCFVLSSVGCHFPRLVPMITIALDIAFTSRKSVEEPIAMLIRLILIVKMMLGRTLGRMTGMNWTITKQESPSAL